MSLDELLHYLKSTLTNPGRLIGQLWLAWWLWTSIRNALTRGGKPRKPALSRPVAKPKPAPKPIDQRPTPAVRQSLPAVRERADTHWQRALARAHELRRRVSSQQPLRRLESIVVEHVIEPLQAALDQTHKNQPVRSSEPRSASALLCLDVLERVVAERAHESDSVRLAQSDAITDAVHAALRQYAESENLGLRGRHALAIRAPLPEAVQAPDWTDQLLLIPVPAGFGADLNDYTALVYDLGCRWYRALPGLALQCQTMLKLPTQVHLPGERVAYDETSVYTCFGPWLASLFAHTALTLRLGSGYVAGLQRSLADDADVTRARAQGAYLDGEPPALLRMHTALAALSALGQHAEAERQRKAFTAAHPALEQSYLPLNNGRFMAIDTAYLLAISEHVSQFLRTTPLEALGGIPLDEVPGFLQTLEDAHRQKALAQAIAQASAPSQADAAQLLCGALIAWQTGSDGQLAVAQLHKGLTLHTAREVPGARAGGTADRPRAPVSLRAAFRDPKTVRSAIILGAVFEPPRLRNRLR
jgi:hypothetical protein